MPSTTSVILDYPPDGLISMFGVIIHFHRAKNNVVPIRLFWAGGRSDL